MICSETCSSKRYTQVSVLYVCVCVCVLAYMGTAFRNSAVSVMQFYQSVKLALKKMIKWKLCSLKSLSFHTVSVNLSTFSSDQMKGSMCVVGKKNIKLNSNESC